MDRHAAITVEGDLHPFLHKFPGALARLKRDIASISHAKLCKGKVGRRQETETHPLAAAF